MATKKKLIELDVKILEILEKQAKEENRSLKNYIENFLEKKAQILSEPSEAYKKMMNIKIEKIKNGTLETTPINEVLARYGKTIDTSR